MTTDQRQETQVSAGLKESLSELRRIGVLLQSDSLLPSVSGIVAAEPIRGSWWGHPKGHDIYRVCEQLTHRRDVVLTKLISGKVTFVHKELWNHLLAIATSKAGWQTSGVSEVALDLLSRVSRAGRLRLDQLQTSVDAQPRAVVAAARELEARLLIHSEEIHTESGSHTKLLQDWNSWAAGMGIEDAPRITATEACERFEDIINRLNALYGASARLPWQAKPLKRARRAPVIPL